VRVWKPEPAAWDSDWRNIAPGDLLTLTHNLGASVASCTVGLWFRDTTPGGSRINARGYGGMEIAGQFLGGTWQNLTENTITVVRSPQDAWADQVRVRLYLPDPPAWDSGWQFIASGASLAL
jgi:hypothetical protein